MPSFNRSHVEKAFTTIRRDGIPDGFGPSWKWDIIDESGNGESFPPKAVLFLAKRFAGDASLSGGGGDRGTNNALRARGFTVSLKESFEGSEIADDIETVLASGTDPTTKKRLINARLGQGGFREELLEIWNNKCALTGCGIPAALRASHITAWRACDNKARLDPDNGILLAASIDALFDKHLITIADNGGVLLSESASKDDVRRLGLAEGSLVVLNSRSHNYMIWHRSESERLYGTFKSF